ncbi:hypothetical protein C8R42DRAFT_724257 [Lentinula raphanica]|nr:hypothetical protein C8R42DRAFT_724257 [Lentinula raphanica]
MFLAPAVPKTPPPLTPPPSKTNATTFPTPTPVISPDNSPNRNPSQIRPSTFPLLYHRFPPPLLISLFLPGLMPKRHNAEIVFGPFIHRVSIAWCHPADKILMRAMRQGEEVEVREVNSVAQAEEWFGTLLLDD